jgi:hypothetical protein
MLCKSIVVSFLFASLLLILTGCGGSSNSSSSTTVPASFTPLIGDYVGSLPQAGSTAIETFDVSITSVTDPTGLSNSQVLQFKTSGSTPPWGFQVNCFTTPSSLVFDSSGAEITNANFYADPSPASGYYSVELNISNDVITGSIDESGTNSNNENSLPFTLVKKGN